MSCTIGSLEAKAGQSGSDRIVAWALMDENSANVAFACALNKVREQSMKQD